MHDHKNNEIAGQFIVQCEVCGESIDASNWHIAKTTESGNQMSILSFCSEDCRDNWEGKIKAG